LHSQLKISSPRWKCNRTFVESVFPTTRNGNGGRKTSGATASS